MTTVPDDPVSTPPEGEPSLDPGAPTPAEPDAEPDEADDEPDEADDEGEGSEPFTSTGPDARSATRRSRRSGTRWLAVAFFLAFLAIGTVVVVLSAEMSK